VDYLDPVHWLCKLVTGYLVDDVGAIMNKSETHGKRTLLIRVLVGVLWAMGGYVGYEIDNARSGIQWIVSS
jgi:hypothetical protein